MGIGLVTIEKTYGGEIFSNTYGVWHNTVGAPLTDADLVAWGAELPFTQSATDPSDPLYQGWTSSASVAGSLLHSLIGFDRSLTFVNVTYTRVYVGDGKSNDDPLTRAFFTTTLNVPGLWPGPLEGDTAIVPGNIVLQVNREPVGFSARRGRIQMRMTLSDNMVRVGGPDMLVFTDAAQEAATRTRLIEAIGLSGIGYAFGADGATGIGGGIVGFGIPRYEAGPENYKTLTTIVPIRDLTVAGPRARQVRRGRRRPSP